MRRPPLIFTLALLLLLPGATGARGASLQPLGSFTDPIYVTSAPGNPNRLLVAERGGAIRQLENGQVSSFADLATAVGCGGSCGGERGLLSIAIANGGSFYVDYANDIDGTIHVAELLPRGGLRDVLSIPHSEESNHNGGQLQFGPDGYLYISTGDGGGNGDPHHNAQKLTSLLGKILRIDPHQSGLLPYTVPAGNPFAAATAPADTIWSYGLRNPFRFSFDRLSGDLTIADVGQGAREEIDYAPAPGLGGGANYGWNCREGLIAGPATDPECSPPPTTVKPVFDYPHVDPGGGLAHGCAIIGGYVVRDRSLGDLYGRYLYGDFCTGQLRSLDLASPVASDRGEGLGVGAENLSSFGEDSCGRLYAAAISGQVYRLVGAAPASCSISTAATGPATGGTVKQIPSYVGIRTASRQVRRGGRALVTAWISPCLGRRGDPVTLWRGGKRLGSRHVDRVCSARFRPRIRQLSNFRARVGTDAGYLGAESRRLTIRIERLAAANR